MKPQRVLMTTDTVGGVWTFTLELARALAAEQIEVVLAALGGRASAYQAADAAAIPGLCLLDSDFKLEWMEEPWSDVKASGRWLLQLEQEYAPDVVHLNSFGHGALAWRAPAVLTAHSCVLSWWQAVKGEDAPTTWDAYRRLVSQSLRAADALTAPSATMAAAMVRHYGIDPVACRVIPNGRKAEDFETASKEPFVFAAGRLWDQAKNVRMVAEIAPQLAWPVFLAGDCADTEADLKGCRLTGRLSAAEIANWYSRASIYVLPARYEPFGLSILEAALSGCALVLGDIRSLRENWNGSALFVPPEDKAALQSALRMLIEDPVMRETLAGQARERARAFDTSRMSRAYQDIYLEAMATASSQTCIS